MFATATVASMTGKPALQGNRAQCVSIWFFTTSNNIDLLEKVNKSDLVSLVLGNTSANYVSRSSDQGTVSYHEIAV